MVRLIAVATRIADSSNPIAESFELVGEGVLALCSEAILAVPIGHQAGEGGRAEHDWRSRNQIERWETKAR
jgi:hypothetical protein